MAVFNEDRTGIDGWHCQRLSELSDVAKTIYYTTKLIRDIEELAPILLP